MKTERLKNQGRLAEMRQTRRRIELSMKSKLRTLRDNFDPFADLTTGIDGEAGAGLALEFAQQQIRLKELDAEIATIEDALGVSRAC